MRSLRANALAVLLLICGAAAAQFPSSKTSPEPLQMEVSSPLALTQKPLALQTRSGRWMPVAATLKNTGDHVRGRLTLRLLVAGDDDRNPTEFFTDVDLPTNSNKRIWLYGRVEREDAEKLLVTFEGRGFKSRKAEGTIQNAPPTTRIVLTVSDSDEKLSYLSGLRGVGLQLPGASDGNVPNFNAPVAANPNLNVSASPVRPLGASHDLVPSRWIGLDAVDLVVLQDFAHTALTPNQIAALRSYAAGGGSILVLGGSNWQRLASSPLADLWPVVPRSSGTANESDKVLLIDRFARFPSMNGADRLGGAPVVATRGALRSGCRVLLGNASAPLLAINDFGAGQVLFLAVDPTQPPFLGWRGLPRLWADVFRPAARPAQIASVGAGVFDPDQGYRGGYAVTEATTPTATGSLLEALATSPQLRTPPVSFIAWFLALYVFFLVPVNYVVLRFLDRRELAWITIPVIVIIFSLMSYAAALRIKGTAILTRQVNLVQGSASINGSGSRWGRSDAMLWLFSPRKTQYDIASADPQMVVADYISDNDTRVAIREPEENESFALDAAPINMWDWRSFVGHSVADLKNGVRLRVQGGSVAIENKTGHDLKGVVLVSHGRVRAYKSIRDGQSALPDAKYNDGVKLSNAQLAGRIENASRIDTQLGPTFSGGATQSEPVAPTGFASIPAKLLGMAVGDSWTTPATFVVAWSDAPISGMTIGREGARAQNLSLLIFRVENDRVLLPLQARDNPIPTPDARVRLLSSESNVGSASKAQGSVYVYEAVFARPRIWRFTVGFNVVVQNPYDYGNDASSAAKIKPTPPVRAEIFNYRSGMWQPLQLADTTPQPQKPSTPAPTIPPPDGARKNSWQMKSTLQGTRAQQCVLEPDGRVHLRITTTNDYARISGVQLR